MLYVMVCPCSFCLYCLFVFSFSLNWFLSSCVFECARVLQWIFWMLFGGAAMVRRRCLQQEKCRPAGLPWDKIKVPKNIWSLKPHRPNTPRRSLKLFAAPQFAMDPAIIILKFAIRSPVGPQEAIRPNRPIGPYVPMGPYGPMESQGQVTNNKNMPIRPTKAR